jgi:hypothetical protein
MASAVYRRRRAVALGAVAALALVVGLGVSALLRGGTSHPARDAQPRRPAAAPPAQLPGGGRTIFPRFRVVAYYGAPQDPQLGELGSERRAGRARGCCARRGPTRAPRARCCPRWS